MDQKKLKSYIGKTYKEIEKEILEDTDYYPSIIFLDENPLRVITDIRINRIILEVKENVITKATKG